jgi:hypothetical protein
MKKKKSLRLSRKVGLMDRVSFGNIDFDQKHQILKSITKNYERHQNSRATKDAGRKSDHTGKKHHTNHHALRTSSRETAVTGNNLIGSSLGRDSTYDKFSEKEVAGIRSKSVEDRFNNVRPLLELTFNR